MPVYHTLTIKVKDYSFTTIDSQASPSFWSMIGEMLIMEQDYLFKIMKSTERIRKEEKRRRRKERKTLPEGFMGSTETINNLLATWQRACARFFHQETGLTPKMRHSVSQSFSQLAVNRPNTKLATMTP